MTDASLFFFPFHPHRSPPSPAPSIAAFVIGILSMAKVGIVGHTGEKKSEEVTVELGQR